MNIHEYRKQYLKLEQKIFQAQQALETFKVSEYNNFCSLYEAEKEKHLNWLATHLDFLQKHKEYIKNSATLSKIVIDFLPLYIGGGLVAGAAFTFGSQYKIYLKDLLDVWDAGFCYEGCPIVSCHIGIHWKTEYNIKYIKNKKILTARKCVQGAFRDLPEISKEVFEKVRQANIAQKYPDMSTYRNIDLLIKIFNKSEYN